MASVYLVTSGSHSDYCVREAFSTREAAERYAASAGDDFGVTEMELDTPEGMMHVRRDYWDARINVLTGAIQEYANPEYVCTEMADPTLRGVPGVVSFRPCGEFYPTATARSYVSREHAAKLAAEARQEFLRAYPQERIRPLPRGEFHLLIPPHVPAAECVAWEAQCVIPDGYNPGTYADTLDRLADVKAVYADWLDDRHWPERAEKMRREAASWRECAARHRERQGVTQ